jgi:hypothetical protein
MIAESFDSGLPFPGSRRGAAIEGRGIKRGADSLQPNTGKDCSNPIALGKRGEAEDYLEVDGCSC